MQYSLAVCHRQRVGDAYPDRADPLRALLVVRPQPTGQRATRAQLHDQVGASVGKKSRVVHRDDAGMTRQVACGLGLSQEPAAFSLGVQGPVVHLDRNRPIQRQLPGAPHGREATPGQWLPIANAGDVGRDTRNSALLADLVFCRGWSVVPWQIGPGRVIGRGGFLGVDGGRVGAVDLLRCVVGDEVSELVGGVLGPAGARRAGVIHRSVLPVRFPVTESLAVSLVIAVLAWVRLVGQSSFMAGCRLCGVG